MFEMKKTILMTMAMLIALMLPLSMLAGCSSAGNQPGGAADSSQPQSNAVNGSYSQNKQPQFKGDEAGEILFGKVKSIVGNEVVLEIGTLPSDGGSENGGAANEGSDTQQIYDAGSGDAGMVIADNGNIMELKPGEENSLELEYTGETKTIIIPAGAAIESVLGEGSLEAVKKGSVLQVELLKDNDMLYAVKVMILLG
jgi:ABC-type cobalt transport system substrate-binding protein